MNLITIAVLLLTIAFYNIVVFVIKKRNGLFNIIAKVSIGILIVSILLALLNFLFNLSDQNSSNLGKILKFIFSTSIILGVVSIVGLLIKPKK